MRPSESEPRQDEIEAFVSDEERQVLSDPSVPDEVKAEILDRLERYQAGDVDQLRAEDARNES
jgi:hypothetical protein